MYKLGEYIYPPPRTFTRYHVTGLPVFPRAETYSIVSQAAFKGFSNEPDSVVINQGALSENSNYGRYWIEHQMRLRRAVILNGEYQTEVITANRFPMFVHNDDPTRVWIQTKQQIGEDFLDRIRRTLNHDLSAMRFEIDVIDLIEQGRRSKNGSEEVVGGWFVQLRIPRVKTAMLAGDDVSDSQDWDRYAKAGILASVELLREVLGEQMRVIVTRRGAIVFRTRIGEEIALRTLDDLAEAIRPFEQVIPLRWHSAK